MKPKKYHTWKHLFSYQQNERIQSKWEICHNCGLFRFEIGKNQHSFSFNRKEFLPNRPECKEL